MVSKLPPTLPPREGSIISAETDAAQRMGDGQYGLPRCIDEFKIAVFGLLDFLHTDEILDGSFTRN